MQAAWLPLIGAVLSFFWINPVQSMVLLISGSLIYKVYVLITMGGIVYQAVAMLYVLFSKNMKAYSKRVLELKEMAQNQALSGGAQA